MHFYQHSDERALPKVIDGLLPKKTDVDPSISKVNGSSDFVADAARLIALDPGINAQVVHEMLSEAMADELTSKRVEMPKTPKHRTSRKEMISIKKTNTITFYFFIIFIFYCCSVFFFIMMVYGGHIILCGG